ncbi:2-polyprenylphenol 6-hydroxylase [Anaplasma marginale]|uniref:2-polyprenylphenol 6-hydroxylase n=1 Tax=Anaplasma marginale TaxID=770 RepID=UPI000E58F671|nr:2-polyprenylphenol 6-hydroxylase [Anaplasma marginale]AXW84831.1 2-polyprenylphenol 6-hydroxylase [Anaplasma marginale]
MFSVIKSCARMLRIVTAILCHGILPYTGFLSLRLRSKTRAERLCILLQSLGPTFIKFGQFLAARVDIVGEDAAKNLLRLCDALPPFSFDDVVKTIECDLRRQMGSIFREFDTVPVAAASVAQVHKAKTLDGELRAVKVLRPGVEQDFRRDIRLMRLLARIFGGCRRLQRFQLGQLVEMFASICRLELDLRFEAANAEELRENTKADRGIFCVPKVDWNCTSKRVLTLQWVDAVPIYEIDKLQDRESLARNLILCFCNQVYKDRFFHADMHPGNLMVDSNNRIVAVDFGIMGRIDEETCVYISEIFIGFLSRDYRRVAEAHLDAGYIPGRCDEFITACRAIWEPIADMSAQGFSMAELLTQLFMVTSEFNMKVQPQLLLLQKTMVLVEGICRQLAPDMNLWKIAELWVQEHGDNHGYTERFKKSQVYRSMRGMRMLASKIDRSLDIIISHDGYRQGRGQTTQLGAAPFLMLVIVGLLVVLVIVK